MLNKGTRLKGYILALIATLAASNVYIFSKAAISEMSLVQFGFYWFAFGLLWNLAYFIPKKKFSGFTSLKKADYIVLFLIGLLETAGTVLFFMAIRRIENPAIVSFLTNITPVFIVIFGFAFLGERYNFIELTGFTLTLAGAFVISFQKGDDLNRLFIDGSGLIVLSSLVLSVAFILAKTSIRRVNASVLSINRIIFLFLLFIVLMILQNQAS